MIRIEDEAYAEILLHDILNVVHGQSWNLEVRLSSSHNLEKQLR